MAGGDPSAISSFRQTPTGELVAALERLAEADTITMVVETLRQVARKLVGSDGICIVLRDGDLCHYVEEDAVGPLWKGGRFPMTACISGWSMLNRATAIVPDIFTDERIPHDLYRATFVRSLVMTPIRERDPLGAIGAYWSNTYHPSVDEVETLRSLARASAGAMERLRLIDRISGALEETELARDELRHRVKNAFVSAQAIGRLTLPPELAGPFGTRIASLARAHDLIDRSVARDSTIALSSLLSTELGSYAVGSPNQLALEGPVVQIPARMATPLGLAVNELATNALKYGALSSAAGRLSVRWRVEGRFLVLDWRESDGPEVAANALESMGSRLLRRLIEGQLKGTLRRQMAPHGMSCTIEIPLDDRVAATTI
jgi:two-component sensor histidine kinase